jgi:DeoR family transcriptional regulator, fructose operon transcriptional repressor
VPTLVSPSYELNFRQLEILEQLEQSFITNNLPIMVELSNSGFDLVMLGGMLRQHSLAMIGPLTVSSLSELHADIVFVGATAASQERGLCTPNIIEAETKTAMINAASERVALIDHTKVGQASLAPFAQWSDIHTLITDEEKDNTFMSYMQHQAVKLVVAKKERVAA